MRTARVVVCRLDARVVQTVSYFVVRADMTIEVWDTATGNCVQTLQGHAGCVTIKVWDTATGNCVQTLRGHCSASPDSTIKGCDTATGKCAQTLHGAAEKAAQPLFPRHLERGVGSNSTETIVVLC